MKYAFIQTHANSSHNNSSHKGRVHSPEAYCHALGVSRSGWQAYLRRQQVSQQQALNSPASDKASHTTGAPASKAARQQAIDSVALHLHAKARGCYGAVRMQAALARAGTTLSLSSTKRLTRRLGLVHRPKRRRICTTDSKHDQPIAANLLEQRFDSIHTPNRVWLCDITYIDTDEGWVYLAGVKDVCSKKLVGWATAQHMRAELVIEALQMAITQERPAPGLICHSDRGSQYASCAYRAMLVANQMQASMSRSGNCYDNAPMESFWASLKKECIHKLHFETAAQATQAVFDYIAAFYNPHRLHTSIGNRSPHEFMRDWHASQTQQPCHHGALPTR